MAAAPRLSLNTGSLPPAIPTQHLSFQTPLTLPPSQVTGSTITAADLRTPQAPPVSAEESAAARNGNLGRGPGTPTASYWAGGSGNGGAAAAPLSETDAIARNNRLG